MSLRTINGFLYNEQLGESTDAPRSSGVFVRYERVQQDGRNVIKVQVLNRSDEEIDLILDRMTTNPNDVDTTVANGAVYTHFFDCITSVGVVASGRSGRWSARGGYVPMLDK